MVLYGVSLKSSPCDNAYRHRTRLETYDSNIDQPTHDLIAAKVGSYCRHHPSAEILVTNCPIHGGSDFGREIPHPNASRDVPVRRNSASRKARRKTKSRRRKTKSRKRKTKSRRRKTKSRKRKTKSRRKTGSVKRRYKSNSH